MSNDEKCPDCVDGFYQGLLEREKCETCGGSGKRSRELIKLDCGATPTTVEVTTSTVETPAAVVEANRIPTITMEFKGNAQKLIDACARISANSNLENYREAFLRRGYNRKYLEFVKTQFAQVTASLGIPPQIPGPTKLIDFSIDVDAIEPPQEVKLQVGDVVIILPCIGTTRRGGRIFADPHGGPSHHVNKFDRLHVFSDGSLVVMHHPTPRVD